MDLASSLVDRICWPTGAYIDDLADPPAPCHCDSRHGNPNTCEEHWAVSRLNPQRRIDALSPLQEPLWRIDGCDSQGTRFLAVPIFMLPRLAPRRIDVCIPDQTRHPPQLRDALGSAWAFCLRDGVVERLGIARLVLRALQLWTRSQPRFGAAFNALPFGSRIVVENVCASPEDMRLRMVPDLTTERQLLSLGVLDAMWDLPAASWPARLDLDQLQHHRQLHDTISLVRIPAVGGDEYFVFKSTVQDVRYLYHELKLLLTMGPHPNVMPRPLYIVTHRDRYGGQDRVYGFILKYQRRGNLAGIISSRAAMGCLDLRDQLRWASEITAGLMHINSSPARFYSELKPDNLLVYAGDDDIEHILFIDFEQMGNWTSFSAPEIHYLEYLSMLEKSDLIPASERERFAKTLEEHMPGPESVVQHGGLEIYSNPPQGYYRVWSSLSPNEQEAAEVFSLGKTLWCIFEGCVDTRNSVLKAYPHDTGLEFPDFQRTPPLIRALIARCTRGAREWAPRQAATGIVRVGARVYPRGKTGTGGEATGTAGEAAAAATAMWRATISDAEVFLTAKSRWRRSCGATEVDDAAFLGFPDRPQLWEVRDAIREAEDALLRRR